MNEQESKVITSPPVWSTPKVEEFDITDITQGKPTPSPVETFPTGPS